MLFRSAEPAGEQEDAASDVSRTVGSVAASGTIRSVASDAGEVLTLYNEEGGIAGVSVTLDRQERIGVQPAGLLGGSRIKGTKVPLTYLLRTWRPDWTRIQGAFEFIARKECCETYQPTDVLSAPGGYHLGAAMQRDNGNLCAQPGTTTWTWSGSNGSQYGVTTPAGALLTELELGFVHQQYVATGGCGPVRARLCNQAAWVITETVWWMKDMAPIQIVGNGTQRVLLTHSVLPLRLPFLVWCLTAACSM